jgi:hypothetical protein
MAVAHHLASRALPDYAHKFSRHDFTLPQPFACPVAKELLKRSYRGIEAVLADSPTWLKQVGLSRAPDHNTLCRAHRRLLTKCGVGRLLDVVARMAAAARVLGLSTRPLAIDSTTFESHHVSRHYERRCHQTRRRMKAKDAERGRKSSRSDTVRRLPKLAVAACTRSHVALALWTGTGAGADHPHFRPLVRDAWSRVPNRRFKVAADAGYDAESTHVTAREGGLRLPTLIPAEIGRPSKTGAPPTGRWRRRMRTLLATTESRRRCGYTQRWQVETVNSMMKRNLGSALAGKTAWSRKRDMALKVLTHNVMIL